MHTGFVHLACQPAPLLLGLGQTPLLFIIIIITIIYQGFAKYLSYIMIEIVCLYIYILIHIYTYTYILL